MKVEDFTQILGKDFYTGVPDSLLKPLCGYLMQTYGSDSSNHVIAANEGLAVALAAGYHLATGKVAVVYLQNSGEGNIVNPVASLLSDKVYGIPMIFIIGFRGEPGVPDEPQHLFQGEITLKLLDVMDIAYSVLNKETTKEEMLETMASFSEKLAKGKQVAFVIRKGALSCDKKFSYANKNAMSREDIIRKIVKVAGEDIIVCTTGKASRELFEIREMNGESHNRDFLTVGSMGHCSAIALGIALQKSEKRVWCIDGDGAALMHMGAMTMLGTSKQENLIHIVINNESHDSVGGMPTVAGKIDFSKIATACGYTFAAKADDDASLSSILDEVKTHKGRAFVEITSTRGSRADLGRPTVSPIDNKRAFMQFISQ